MLFGSLGHSWPFKTQMCRVDSSMLEHDGAYEAVLSLILCQELNYKLCMSVLSTPLCFFLSLTPLVLKAEKALY